jgi:NADH dehydrogenase
MSKKHILVVGGGFGGIKTALELSKNDQLAVTLVSDRPDFLYYPALYHTATGGLREQSSIKLETIIDKNPIKLVVDTATKIDRKKRVLLTKSGQHLNFDILILAIGSVTNYFGIAGLKEFSYGVKSVAEVQALKRHLHQQLTTEHRPDLHYVIVGAGPTGIELAGALPAYLHNIVKKHGIKHRAIRVSLIEAAPRLLPRSPKATSRAVRRRLRKLGVKLYLNQAVQGETADSLMINGQPLSSRTVVWTAGMANHPFFEANGFKVNERHKVIVDNHLQAEDHIYVIGDNASTPFSGMAQTALLDASFVAKDIQKQLSGESRPDYVPEKPISVIPAGPRWAAVEWGNIHFSGFRGWLLRQAADWAAYHDLEPWWKASEQWLTGLGHEERCPVCSGQLQR